MAKLSAHQSGKYVKILYIGDSGTGKTGSLTSLVKAGYKLKVLDLDNGLDALRQWISHEKLDPDQVDFETLRDEMTITSLGPTVKPLAYMKALKLMSEWSDGTKPSEAGEKDVFVLDSLTALGKAAFEWARAQSPAAKDPRQWYFAAQQTVDNVLGMLTSAAFKSNLVIISHINYKELEEGVHKGHPTAVGSAMGPAIPRYFNTMIQAEIRGSGKDAKRTIKTLPTSVIDLKNPAPFKLEPVYDLGTGLASIFEAIKEA
jgi:hypothetical protein